MYTAIKYCLLLPEGDLIFCEIRSKNVRQKAGLRGVLGASTSWFISGSHTPSAATKDIPSGLEIAIWKRVDRKCVWAFGGSQKGRLGREERSETSNANNWPGAAPRQLRVPDVNYRRRKAPNYSLCPPGCTSILQSLAEQRVTRFLNHFSTVQLYDAHFTSASFFYKPPL